jgi:hypothetical protein
MDKNQFDELISAIKGLRTTLWWIALWLFLIVTFQKG